jgi:hypothetical protein
LTLPRLDSKEEQANNLSGADRRPRFPSLRLRRQVSIFSCSGMNSPTR